MATKPDANVQEFQFRVVPKTTKWESFQRALYDPDKKEFFGRTRKNWYQLLKFYTVFYLGLAAFCAICMQGLLKSLDDNQPTYILGESLIGTSPGLGFRPISNLSQEGSLIWYNVNNATTVTKWTALLDEFLHLYKLDQIGKNYQKCGYDRKPACGDVCTVEMDLFGPCTSQNNYGYNSSSPCVFLKLNRIFGWVPDVDKEPQQEMPADLKETIQTNTNRTDVWISCQGESPFDRERIVDFRYYPNNGFPEYYFPYTNSPNYLSPLIAVQIMNVTPNSIISVQCRAWAKNIRYNGGDRNREGSVHFEILQDT